MEFYAFGSLVRGQIDISSDIDLLILKKLGEKLPDVDKEKFSIYSYERISELWEEGNPFAWHLFIESKCVYTEEKVPFLSSLGRPGEYKDLLIDLNKFYTLFLESRKSIIENPHSIDFDFSMIFLAIRNFASCFSLGVLKQCEFSRDSALKIGEYSIHISNATYSRLRQSRLLSTRGIGELITENEATMVASEFSMIENWFNKLLSIAN